jgi:hypothetical protein
MDKTTYYWKHRDERHQYYLSHRKLRPHLPHKNYGLMLAGLTKETLLALYHEKKMTQEAIAVLYGVTQGAVMYWMKKWQIPPRSKEEVRERLRIAFSGSNNPTWNGGRHIDHGGYVLIRNPQHQRADNRGYVKEHIKVWMETHGREVPQGWQVHHINGNKKDNRPENLVALSNKRHRRVIPLLQRRIRYLEKLLDIKREKDSSPKTK